MPGRPPLDAVVFDLDGLLVDSEPLWHEAEIAAFGAVGFPLTVADCLNTTGLRIDAWVRFGTESAYDVWPLLGPDATS